MAIYFIRAGTNGPVKIGFSENVPMRLVKMQADNHERLTVLGIMPGDRQVEFEVQAQFSHLLLQGEWFAWARDLSRFIAEHAAPMVAMRSRRMADASDSALCRWLKDKGETLETFALKCGLSAASLSRLSRGEQFPSRASAERIMSATEGAVTAADFAAPFTSPTEPESITAPVEAA